MTPEETLLDMAQDDTKVADFQRLFEENPDLDVNTRDRKGRTALMYIAGGYPSKSLLEYFVNLPGIDLTLEDNTGHDALYYIKQRRQGVVAQQAAMAGLYRTRDARLNHAEMTERLLAPWDSMIAVLEEAIEEQEAALAEALAEAEEEEGARIRESEDALDAAQEEYRRQQEEEERTNTGEPSAPDTTSVPEPTEEAPVEEEEAQIGKVPKGGRKRTRRGKKRSIRKTKKKATRKATKKNRKK